jgi:tRNA (guanine26-N2/guanine27-N2)-dimethyltransferase
MIREGKVLLKVEVPKVVSSEMPVFYNPTMVVNRDISLLIVWAMEGEELVVCDPMGASGVRSLRFLLEVPKVKKVIYNDIDQRAVESFREHLRINHVPEEKVEIYSEDASLLLRKLRNCHYVDIDPYGSPIPFLDSAVFPVKRDGVLSVTATDTAVLSGTYPSTCQRRYSSKPLLECEFYHEVGIRILIKKVIEEGAKHDYALKPIFSYSYKHHFKVFFRKDIGARRTDKLIEKIGYLLYCTHCLYREGVSLEGVKGQCPHCGHKLLVAGPLWLGGLWEKETVERVCSLRGAIELSEETAKLLKKIRRESEVNSLGFYSPSYIARAFKLSQLPPKEFFLKFFEGKPTHFSPEGFRTSLEHGEFLRRLHEFIQRGGRTDP